MAAVIGRRRRRFEARVRTSRSSLGRRTLPLLALTVLALLSACGGSSTPTPTVAPTPTRVASPVATPAPVEIAQVTWAKAIDAKTGAPVTPVERFSTADTTVYAVLQAPDLPKGATLSATWSFNGVPVPVPPQTVTIMHGERSSWVEFHLTWAGAGSWPDGTLKIAIAVDGRLARTASVAIVRPGGAIRDDIH